MLIETTVPEIDVTELMERVRAQALQPKPPPRPPAPREEKAVSLPPVAMLPAAPAVWIPAAVKSRKERLDALVQTAREKNEPDSRIPKFLRRFFRKQGGYNRAMLEGVRALATSNQDLTQRVTEISVCLGQLNSWLQALHEQSDADANWMKAAAPGIASLAGALDQLKGDCSGLEELVSTKVDRVSNDLESMRSGLEELVSKKVTDVRSDLESMRSGLEEFVDAKVNAVAGSRGEHINRLEVVEAKIEEHTTLFRARGELETSLRKDAALLRGQLDRAGVHLRNLQAQTDSATQKLGELTSRHDETAADLQRQIDAAAIHLRNLQGQSDRLGVHVNNLQGFADTHVAETTALHRRQEQRASETVEDFALVKGELSEHSSLLRRLLSQPVNERESSKKNGPTEATAQLLDTFYYSFENRFRGTRAEIKQRVAFYLPFIRNAKAGTAARPVLDLGCGRGEWLELLKEQKLTASGVDINTAMIAQCKAYGLKANLGDALEHLSSLRANSQGAVTGFHIIEHLSFPDLMELFARTRRVLKPGGVAIFESPNCKNLVVGASTFHIDPTHRSLVFPEAAEFMLASHGFENIRIEYLSPVPNNFDATSPELATIRDLLYGPQDFGVIAYKPRTR